MDIICQWIGSVGKIFTGKHRFFHEIWGVPVNVPLNQSIESACHRYMRKKREIEHEEFFLNQKQIDGTWWKLMEPYVSKISAAKNFPGGLKERQSAA